MRKNLLLTNLLLSSPALLVGKLAQCTNGANDTCADAILQLIVAQALLEIQQTQQLQVPHLRFVALH